MTCRCRIILDHWRLGKTTTVSKPISTSRYTPKPLHWPFPLTGAKPPMEGKTDSFPGIASFVLRNGQWIEGAILQAELGLNISFTWELGFACWYLKKGGRAARQVNWKTGWLIKEIRMIRNPDAIKLWTHRSKLDENLFASSEITQYSLQEGRLKPFPNSALDFCLHFPL